MEQILQLAKRRKGERMNQTEIDSICEHPVLNRLSRRGEHMELYGRCCYCSSFVLVDGNVVENYNIDMERDKAYKKS